MDDLEQSVARGAQAVHEAFVRQHAAFVAVSRRARERFERRDWRGQERDALERLGLYGRAVSELRERLGRELGPALADREFWGRIKPAYAALAGEDANFELARTFFNSVTRRIFGTVGVDPRIEFASIELDRPFGPVDPRILARYAPRDETAETILRILEDHRFAAPHRDPTGDAQRVARRVDDLLLRRGGAPVEAFEVLRPDFFRNKGAYLVGRIRCGSATLPLVLPLLHEDGGVVVDAVLTDPADVSILFSFTRSHFHVDADCPRSIIAFLKSIMPEKPIPEVYIALGLYKHGKTELYRSLQRHLDRTSDLFEVASGDEGLVMLVFTLPSFDRVFKLIRDEFAFPKTTTPEDVRQRYRMVFERDRVGRLVETQQFAHLKFRRDRFAPALLEQLRRGAARTVHEDGDWLVIEHLYTERRVRPLNLYLREAASDEARLAILDYGAAIKELAAANIFPGDFLLKNFGVTRHGRVVFYDYDELCLLTDCRFRELPTARTPEDELAAEPWFTVGEQDVFPEEFRRFLGIPQRLIEPFERHHGDLFTAAFWRSLQARQLAGEILDFYPYPADRRLRP